MGGREAAVFDLEAGDVDQHAHAQAGGAGGRQVAAVGRPGEEDHRRVGGFDGRHGGVGVGAGAEDFEVRALSGVDLLGAVAAGLRGHEAAVSEPMTAAHDVAADLAGEGAGLADAFERDVGEPAGAGVADDKDASLVAHCSISSLDELFARQEVSELLGAVALVLDLHAGLAGLGHAGGGHRGLGAGQADARGVEAREPRRPWRPRASAWRPGCPSWWGTGAR